MPRSLVNSVLATLLATSAAACGSDDDDGGAAPDASIDAPVASGCGETPAPGPLGLLDEIESGLQIHPAARFDGETIWLAYTANDVENMSVFDTALMRLSCAGELFGEPVRVTTTSGRNEIDPAIAIGRDSVLVAWQSDDGTGVDNLDIVVRAFGLDGTPRTQADITIEPRTQDGTPVTGNAFYPSVVGGADGDFVLAGSNVLPGAPTFRAFAHNLDSDGNLVGSIAELAPPGPETHSAVSVAADATGTASAVFTEAQQAGDVVMLTSIGGSAHAAPLFPGSLSSTPTVAASGASRVAAASVETSGERDIGLISTDESQTHATSFGAPGALDHTPAIAIESEQRGAVAYYRNLGGFRNQLVVVAYTVDHNGGSIVVGSPIEIAHEMPAPPYAPAIVHIRDGVYFVAWAEGTSPEFMLRAELVSP